MAGKKIVSAVEVEDETPKQDYAAAEKVAAEFAAKIKAMTPQQREALAEFQKLWRDHVGKSGHKRLAKAFMSVKLP